MIAVFLLCVFGYIVGSTPFGLILTKLAGLGDIREIGSGNIGATNVLRTGRRGLAAATLLLDGGKGAFVVFYATLYGHGGVLLAGLSVFLGHLYPFWLNFKGGKGVATGLGVLFGLAWQIGAICCAIWLVTAVLLRRSSVAALTAFAFAPVATWYFTGWQAAVLVIIISALVFWRHRGNIARLLDGTEPRIGQKR
jgi:glycerol-3-phosphate acyltransferase PlsY